MNMRVNDPRNQNGNQGGMNRGGNNPNGNQGQQGNQNNQGQGQQGKSFDYSNLWGPSAENSPRAPMLGSPVKFDQKSMDSHIQNQSYVRNLPPELLQKALGGDANAFMQILNGFGRLIHRQITMESAAALDGAFQNFSGNIQDWMPSQLKMYNTSNDINSKFETLAKNPAYAPMLNAVSQQMASKNPGATEAEIKEMTANYFNDFFSQGAEAMGYKKSEENANGQGGDQGMMSQLEAMRAPQETNWAEFGDFQQFGGNQGQQNQSNNFNGDFNNSDPGDFTGNFNGQNNGGDFGGNSGGASFG